MSNASETEDSSSIEQPDTFSPPFPRKTLLENLYQNAHNTFHNVCNFAEYLDKNKHVYWLYGGPDGFVLAYSMLKYVPDLIYNGSKTETARALRDFITNPWGNAITIAWLTSLTLWSAYANGISKQKNNPDAQAFYVTWQSFRDSIKGLRNAHRGIRSTLDAIHLISSVDARYALLPLGLILGIPSMYNRWWNRQMVTIRKKTMDKNKSFSEELLNWGRFNDEHNILPASEETLKNKHANSFLLIDKNNFKNRRLYYINRQGEAEDLKLNTDEIAYFLEKKNKLPQHKDKKHPSVIQWKEILPQHAEKHFIAFHKSAARELQENIAPANHAHNNRVACEFSAAYGGFVDGLYLFMGLISLVTLSPEILITVAVISTVCMVACIFTRLQEEWEYDKLLRISEQKAQLTASIKQHQAELATVGLLTIQLKQTLDSSSNSQAKENLNKQLKKAETRLDDTQSTIRQLHNELLSISSISTIEAVLTGLKLGLTAHGTLVCGLFAAAVIGKVFFAAILPQAVILACVILSIVITIASIQASVSYIDQYNKKLQAEGKTHYNIFQSVVDKIKNARDAYELSDIDNEAAFSAFCDGTPYLNWTLLSWLEVLRSTGSGIMKGPKSVDFFWLTFFDGSSQHDQQHDHPALSLALVISLILCAFIWCLRALAKFSKDLRDTCAKSLKQATAAEPEDSNKNPPTPPEHSHSSWPLTRNDSPPVHTQRHRGVTFDLDFNPVEAIGPNGERPSTIKKANSLGSLQPNKSGRQLSSLAQLSLVRASSLPEDSAVAPESESESESESYAC